MACIKPFMAIRPDGKIANRVAALPYDVFNREEAAEEVRREPLSFLRVDRAETFFDHTVDTYDDQVYEKAKETLWNMVKQGDMKQDKNPFYYIYELVMNGRLQTGIVACASVDDYSNGIIMKHENTRADKEIDRIKHVDKCNAQTGPIFLAYRSNPEINRIVLLNKEKKPVYDFASLDSISHRVWIIDEEQHIQKLQEEFEKMNHIYIADGHHRCASAVKVAQKRRIENPGYGGEEDFNFFLSVLFPDDQLMIMDYNRVIKNLNGHTEESLITKLSDFFIVESKDISYRPKCKGEIGMFINNHWYRLMIRNEYLKNDAVEGLDVSLLQDLVLEPIFGIQDPKTDKNIDFVGGIRGLEELERRVCTDCKVAFAMYPTSIKELFAVADEHKLMPPKSTWFEPKLRSGLFIHRIG